MNYIGKMVRGIHEGSHFLKSGSDETHLGSRESIPIYLGWCYSPCFNIKLMRLVKDAFFGGSGLEHHQFNGP